MQPLATLTDALMSFVVVLSTDCLCCELQNRLEVTAHDTSLLLAAAIAVVGRYQLAAVFSNAMDDVLLILRPLSCNPLLASVEQL